MSPGATTDGPGAGILSVDEAEALLAQPTLDLEFGALRDAPVLVVDDAHRLPDEVEATLSALPAISVGIAPAGTAPGCTAFPAATWRTMPCTIHATGQRVSITPQTTAPSSAAVHVVVRRQRQW